MRLNEVFYSIQGEGRSVGHPVLFIRLSGCNLQCGFCDTKYHLESKENFEPHELALLKKHKHWVFTGGEPLLQDSLVVNLIQWLEPDYVEIETNGTLLPSEELQRLVDQWNISPKESRFQLQTLNTSPNILAMKKLNRKTVKFVYVDKESEKFIDELVMKFEINPLTIWIMPEGRSKEDQEKLQQHVWNYCLKKGYKFSPRLQATVWDIKRGV